MKENTTTTIRQLLSENMISVPDYQRAYSWETSFKSEESNCQVNMFLTDLLDYRQSASSTPYYLGHFLFEGRVGNRFGIIDGQQRLTTVTIFLCALFYRLGELRKLTNEESALWAGMIKSEKGCHFSTVKYDDLFFKDYVVNHRKTDRNGMDTESQKRIADAYDYFTCKLAAMTENDLLSLLAAVADASCTTHVVEEPAEAVQMFIFQNNRGKHPSNLEILKAKFMYHVHLHGGSEEEKNELLDEIKTRFEEINKSIANLEAWIDEDDVLAYVSCVHFNSLWANDAMPRVDKELEKGNNLEFIRNFCGTLADGFRQLKTFIGREPSDDLVHSLLHIADFGILMPFMIKVLDCNVPEDDFRLLASAFESIFIRARVIATRADLSSRLNDCFQNFDGDVHPIVERIERLKTGEGWEGYWNNYEYKRALRGGIYAGTAKFLLWKYENHLIQTAEKSGYGPIRFDSIDRLQLEHIAPRTENPESGYCSYDEEFLTYYLECLGNYLLISGSHNQSIGNIPFAQKRETYTYLRQQQEVQKMTEQDCRWDKEKIKERQERITGFLAENY